MKPLPKHLACLLLLLQCSSPAFAESEKWLKIAGDYRRAVEEWKAADDPAQLEAAVRALKPLLKIRNEEGPGWRNEQERGNFDLLDWRVAMDWADAGKYEDSLRCLKAEAAQPGVFLHETRNPDYFACDVFKLHSEIMAHTGKVADIPYSGYQVFQGPSSEGVTRYLFVWEPYETEETEKTVINGITVEDIDEDEQTQMICLTECGADKRCQFADRTHVISKRGKLKVSTAERPDGFVLILNGVSKVVEYKGEFQVPFIHPSSRTKIELRVDKEGVEQPLDALVRMDGKAKDPK